MRPTLDYEICGILWEVCVRSVKKSCSVTNVISDQNKISSLHSFLHAKLLNYDMPNHIIGNLL